MNYPKLKPAVKAKWLKALRSGEYKKGMNQLCIVPLNEGGEYSFCCLGVLQDVAVKEGVSDWRPVGQSSGYTYGEFQYYYDSFLEGSTVEWAFGEKYPENLTDLQHFLASRNDGDWTDDKGFAPKAWTHARIADWANL